uniref:Uncharacterized protein n=1 Tax=viral metagenome TaxID=1070528 RepID=A0A6C0AF03_9ZZZZ
MKARCEGKGKKKKHILLSFLVLTIKVDMKRKNLPQCHLIFLN